MRTGTRVREVLPGSPRANPGIATRSNPGSGLSATQREVAQHQGSSLQEELVADRGDTPEGNRRDRRWPILSSRGA
jgi:hypothetical protein